MKKESIQFSQWKVLRGKHRPNNEEWVLQPDEDGFIRLRIDGDTARMGGVNWSSDRYLVIDMTSDMDAVTTVDISFFGNTGMCTEDGGKKEDSKREDSKLSYQMLPAKRVQLVVKLDELKSRRHFLPALPGTLKGQVRGKPADIAVMNAVELTVHPGYSHIFRSFTIHGIYLSDQIPDRRVQGKPMVDEMGQWIQKDWNTKTHNKDELVAYLKQEYRRAKEDNHYPGNWSRYGGYRKIEFETTGYFHTHFDGKRWWLADPDGYAFFSNGVCYGSRMGDFGFTDRMESLYSWLPGKNDTIYQKAWTTADQIPEFVKRNGVDAGKGRYLFNFARANMIRAFGPEDWWDAWVAINGSRLKRWGFNTIGVGVNNYMDEKVMEYLDKVKIPFVWTLKEFPQTRNMIFRDFPDVFSREFAENAEQFAEKQLSPFVGNPYMIGYFVNNEPEWLFQASVNPAERAFAHQERLATKDVLINKLKEKYGTVEALNRAWNKTFKGFDDLYVPFENADTFTAQSEEDMKWLREILLKKYASVTAEALHKVDPDHMNLGMRYGSISRNELAGAESYDVLSYNCYRESAVPSLSEISGTLDMPAIIGEWHIGGGDRGLLSHGLLSSPTQEERGKACEYYMQSAMSHRNCVGIHYFEMNDQPLLGRFDGECMQHGMIDVCNRPYQELVEHLVHTNSHLYKYVLGEMEPTATRGIIRRSQ